VAGIGIGIVCAMQAMDVGERAHRKPKAPPVTGITEA
jgi:hypothetical protein